MIFSRLWIPRFFPNEFTHAQFIFSKFGKNKSSISDLLIRPICNCWLAWLFWMNLSSFSRSLQVKVSFFPFHWMLCLLSSELLFYWKRILLSSSYFSFLCDQQMLNEFCSQFEGFAIVSGVIFEIQNYDNRQILKAYLTRVSSISFDWVVVLGFWQCFKFGSQTQRPKGFEHERAISRNFGSHETFGELFNLTTRSHQRPKFAKWSCALYTQSQTLGVCLILAQHLGLQTGKMLVGIGILLTISTI